MSPSLPSRARASCRPAQDGRPRGGPTAARCRAHSTPTERQTRRVADPLGIAALEGERPLTGAYRLLRRVGPPDSPIAGWLARCAGGRTVLLAEPEALPGDHPLAGAEGAHVLTPRDLVRTRDGVGVEFDWCVDRLDRVLSRRADAEAPLTAGETVTLVVSLRR